MSNLPIAGYAQNPFPIRNALALLAYKALSGVSVMIELGNLEKMFSEMRANTDWNVDGPMLWGYFFFDRSAQKLQLAATNLTAQGYRLAGIHETDDGSTRVLHVVRVEVHSPQTLFARNKVLDELANQLGLDCYDGMDVGPPPS